MIFSKEAAPTRIALAHRKRVSAGPSKLQRSNEEVCHISLNVTARDAPAVLRQKTVAVSKDARQGSARVVPFVDDLLEHAGIGMLRNKTCSQHLDAFAGNLLDNRRIVKETPATELHQVAELPRVHAKFVLV